MRQVQLNNSRFRRRPTVPPLTARWDAPNSSRQLRSGIRRAASSLLAGLALSACLAAQDAGSANSSGQPTLKTLAAPDSAKPDHRRFFLETATFSLRGKYSVDDRVTDLRRDSQAPYTVALKGKLLLSPKGRLSLNGVLGTGNRFNRGNNPSGIGSAEPITNLYPRQLYLSASPWKPLELQYGGLGLERGESSNITAYNDNGYIVGQRMLVRDNNRLYFDEIAVTGGFLGDLDKPSVFRRLPHLDRLNYGQFLVRKNLVSGIFFSADYTFDREVQTLRQAVRWNLQANRWIDTLIYEQYERINRQQAFGFSIQGQKQLTAKFRVTGSFVDIDRSFGNLNSEKLGSGRRFFAVGSYSLLRDLTLSLMATHTLNYPGPVVNKARYELQLTYDLLPGLKRTRLF
jgi:hypothetical protein